jgi:hypothetical protein
VNKKGRIIPEAFFSSRRSGRPTIGQYPDLLDGKTEVLQQNIPDVGNIIDAALKIRMAWQFNGRNKILFLKLKKCELNLPFQFGKFGSLY